MNALYEEIDRLKNEISDAWCLAFNLWPGDKDPSWLNLNDVIQELANKYIKIVAEKDALTKSLQKDIGDYLMCISRQKDEIERLNAENKRLWTEGERLRKALEKIRHYTDDPAVFHIANVALEDAL